MKIALGYGNKPTHIRVDATAGQNLHLWIEQEGLKELTKSFQVNAVKGKTVSTEVLDAIGHSETLAYMTFNEAMSLIRELQDALIEVVKGEGRY